MVNSTPADKKMVEDDLKKALVCPPSSILIVDDVDIAGNPYFPPESVRTRIADFVKNCPNV